MQNIVLFCSQSQSIKYAETYSHNTTMLYYQVVYNWLILPVVLYGKENWSMTLR